MHGVSMNGKVALITGAGSGLGLCMAQTFARAGGRCV
jgi:NAD(P)-dependent dehydrogenase (short-subunit alcohol dehydrogenase family)